MEEVVSFIREHQTGEKVELLADLSPEEQAALLEEPMAVGN